MVIADCLSEAGPLAAPQPGPRIFPRFGYRAPKVRLPVTRNINLPRPIIPGYLLHPGRATKHFNSTRNYNNMSFISNRFE